ncbi:MAG TPA: hypothetical protein VMN36_14860 [Verrucomicrobiales bacterium]|nr:hypothetical protein [Verrucomicrobiales bacterium]
MFQVSLSQIVEFYLALVFSVIAILGLAPRARAWFRRRRRARRIAVCPLCGTTHPALAPSSLTECPTCGRLNEAGRFPA